MNTPIHHEELVRIRRRAERLKAWAQAGAPDPTKGSHAGNNAILDHFFDTSDQWAPNLRRPTNIGYLMGTNVTRALIYRAYDPDLFWVRVEQNAQHEHHAMNPVRNEDVVAVLAKLGFRGNARWVDSGANHVFGMPFDWRIRWRDMGGGHERIYFVRFGETVKTLSPMLFNREFKRELRIPGVNEYLGSLGYTEDRLFKVRLKLERWKHPEGNLTYKMEKPVLKLIGNWCSKQVLADLGLAS